MNNNLGFNFDNSYLTLPTTFFDIDSPAEFPEPCVAIVNENFATEIGLDFSSLSSEEKAKLFCGNLIPEGTSPFSQAYAGHQFGNFTNLGDGRAHLLGEHLTPEGVRLDIQFKGSGRTHYSRRGDGLAAVGPMHREYILSEAMHALGIPTTRSLAVVHTGETILRERHLPGAVLTRVASSHIRVGTFEYAAATRNPDNISALLDYTVERHFPELAESQTKAMCLLHAVMERQIHLILDWMRVGFIHGVMNTDNVLLSGETIDYGPCAFMDRYHPDQVFSSIDQQGRYAYANQAPITQWNLVRLAEALLPVMGTDLEACAKEAEELLISFEQLYQKAWLQMMRKKLGLLGEAADDETLINDLLAYMQRAGADFTNTFRDLSTADHPTITDEEFTAWYLRYQNRRLQHGQSIEHSIALMQSVNPFVIPRNHQVEEALSETENNNLGPMLHLLEVLKKPYDYTQACESYQSPPEPSAHIYQTFCGT